MKKTLLLLCLFFGLSVALQAQVNTRGGSVTRAELKVFPNPAIDDFQVSTNDQIKQVRVFNLVGQRVKEYTYDRNRKYYVGDLPRGTYLVQLVGAKNKTLVTRRLNKD